MGITATGMSLGGLVLAPLAGTLIDRLGWRAAFSIVGDLMFVAWCRSGCSSCAGVRLIADLSLMVMPSQARPVVSGYLYDVTGSYASAFSIYAIAQVAGGLLVLCVGRPAAQEESTRRARNAT